MKTIHVMKTLNKALFAFLLVVPFLMVDAAAEPPAMIGNGTIIVQATSYGGMSGYIQMPDGSTRPLLD